MPELTCEQLLADIRERAADILETIEHTDGAWDRALERNMYSMHKFIKQLREGGEKDGSSK